MQLRSVASSKHFPSCLVLQHALFVRRHLLEIFSPITFINDHFNMLSCIAVRPSHADASKCTHGKTKEKEKLSVGQLIKEVSNPQARSRRLVEESSHLIQSR
eukprot:TRINITY_DN9086_c0_g1_i5.p1 TRINITY_DN9086_c0_g1~~TRINITY_DN9086_c0_g1_i5.p1  ORF type:complete len:102 (+),score=4.38 TRINITY_DN9086_c0_g1_i5:90-395(+)